MNIFKIGQKVVCINARYYNGSIYPLTKGKIYTVYGFYTCDCGSEQIYLEEIPDVVTILCLCNRTGVRRHSYYAFRFRPLQYYDAYNELFQNKKEQGKKADIPEKMHKKTKKIKAL